MENEKLMMELELLEIGNRLTIDDAMIVLGHVMKKDHSKKLRSCIRYGDGTIAKIKVKRKVINDGK